jgi:hypothetical protein
MPGASSAPAHGPAANHTPPTHATQARSASTRDGIRRCFTEKYEDSRERSRGTVCFTLPEGHAGLPFGNIEIAKCFSLKKDVLTVSYALTNRGGTAETFCFVPEINLSFAGEGEEFVRFLVCKGGVKDAPPGEFIRAAEGLKIQDLKNEVQIQCVSAVIFDGCIQAARIGEHYQSNRIMPLFTLSLESGETWRNEFTLRFSH